MQLEPVFAGGSTGGGSSPGTPGTVILPQEKRQAVGVALGKAEKAPWTGTLRLLGRVAPDEGRTYRVNAASEIWLRKVGVGGGEVPTREIRRERLVFLHETAG